MLSKINWNLISLLIICLFPLMLSLEAQTIPVALGVIIQLVLVIKKRKKRNTRGIWFPMMMSLPIILLLISLIYSDNLHQGLKFMERQIVLLIFPWVLFFNRDLYHRNLQSHLLTFFAISMTGLTIYILTLMILTGKFFTIIQLPNSYYYIREFIGQKVSIHPTYFSILLSISLFSALNEIIENCHSVLKKWSFYFVLTTLFIGLLMATSKMIMTATFIGSAIILYDKVGIRSSFKILIIPLMGITILFAVVSPLRDRASELIKALSETEININNPDSMRKAIYKGTLSAIEENPWIGVGIGDVQETLNYKYRSLGYSEAVKEGYNTHNHYLHFWLATGVLGFLLLIGVQIVQMLIAVANRNSVHLAIMVVFSLSMLTENILSRQVGIYTFSFFTSILTYCSWEKCRNRIAINGRFLTQPISGVQRYAREISSHLLTESFIFKIVTPLGSDRFHPNQLKIPLFKNTMWEQFTLPIYLHLKGGLILLNLCNTAPLLYPHNYVTLHDAAFMKNKDWFTRRFLRWYRFLIPRIMKNAKGIFTVSEFSKSEIIKHFAVPSDHIMVTYNGIPEFTLKETIENKLINEKYALTVGALSSRKNQEYIIKCFTELENKFPMKLVVAGDFNEQVLSENYQLRKAIESNSNIIWIKQPTDKELHNLYTNAICTLYMPKYEGFGLPVLESLLYRKPTIVSDIEVFRELFGDLVLYSPLGNQRQLLIVLRNFAENSKLKTLNASTLSKLKQRFSYKNSAKLICERITSDLV